MTDKANQPAFIHCASANRAAAIDLNTACTSFLYSLSTATALIRTGVVKNDANLYNPQRNTVERLAHEGADAATQLIKDELTELKKK